MAFQASYAGLLKQQPAFAQDDNDLCARKRHAFVGWRARSWTSTANRSWSPWPRNTKPAPPRRKPARQIEAVEPHSPRGK